MSTAEWKALGERRIFFGHQSVGSNIMQGVRDVVAAHPEAGLNVVETKDIPAQAPGFYHAKVGRNYYPLEKAEEFNTISTRGLAAPGSIGMLKFCFVDADSLDDATALFEAYRKAMADLRNKVPGLTVVHFTMPLFTDGGSWNYFKGRIRGYPSERKRNVVRNQFNALVHQAFDGREPVFDIAALESRRADGSRFTFTMSGKTVDALAPELTDDGGHLNRAAQGRVAEQLLIFLAKLPRQQSAGQGS
jgi:hypothetical protein